MASLDSHGADEHREAFYMALEPRFEAFDADVGIPQVSSVSYPELWFKNALRPMELESTEMAMGGATGNVWT